MDRRIRRVGIIVATATLVATAVTPAVGIGRRSLPDSVPRWAIGAPARGAVIGSTPVEFRVYLEWSHADAAAQVAHAVSTPGNAAYGKYLSAAGFRARFAPSAASVAAVARWLKRSGLRVEHVPDNRHYLQVSGTAAQANAAFATIMTWYDYQGMRMMAPATALRVPSTLPAISGVIGLDDTVALVQSYRRSADAPPAPGYRNGDPTSAYFAEKHLSDTSYAPHGDALPGAVDYPYVVKGYTPQQLRTAYGLDQTGLDGAGVTVAVIDAYASATIEADVNQYSANHGLPPLQPGQLRQVTPPGTYHRAQNRQQDPQGWSGEETLDIEAIHAMAPAADIVYVGSPNNYRDLDAAMNRVVDKQLATIVSNSYGFPYELLPRGFVKPLNDTLIQAAAEGIGVYFSSGDDGDLSVATGGTPFPAWPATSPWVTAVGGTSLAIDGDGHRMFETGWQTGKSTLGDGPAWSDPFYLYGSGGGTSYLFRQPDWQAGVVPDALALDTRDGSDHRSARMRTIPDVAMVGDPTTGFLVGQTQTFSDGVRYDESRTGGTSLSCPLMAGVMALAEQAHGSPIGFANPALYRIAATGYRDVRALTDELTSAGLGSTNGAEVRSEFSNGQDATDGYVYSLRYLGWDAPLTIHTTDGYDTVTGLGTPKGGDFVHAFDPCGAASGKVKSVALLC